VLLQRQGEAEKALELYQEALERLRRRQDQFGVATVLSNIGEVHLDLENTGEALLMLKKSIRAAEDANYRHILPTTHCLLSIAYLLLDRPSTAFDHAEKGLQLAEEIGNMPYAGMAYRTLGITAAALERQGHLPSIVPSGGPEAYFTTSMEILSGLNFSYEQARTLLAWGTYLRQSHDPTRRAKGESYLKRAAAQFEQLDLPLPRPSSLGQRKHV
jgi:tetratricopeptide (TPR) repeat protein